MYSHINQPDKLAVGLAVAGAPFRAILKYMPLTNWLLRTAAETRHAVYADIVRQGNPDAKAAHTGYVRAFYDGVVCGAPGSPKQAPRQDPSASKLPSSERSKPPPARTNDDTVVSGLPVEKSFQMAAPQGLINVAYTEWGLEGAPTLLCIHGFTRNSRDFDMLAQALSHKWRVIAIDMPGRGRSDWLRKESDYNLAFYVAAIEALSLHLDTPQFELLGTSMGGLIGMLLAAQPNTMVQRLVLNDLGPFTPKVALKKISTYTGTMPTFDTLIEVELYLRKVYTAGFGQLTDEQWKHLAKYSSRLRRDGKLALNYDPKLISKGAKIAGYLPQMFWPDIEVWSIYDAIRCPTLVLRGGNSEVLLANVAEAMTERGPQATLVEFDYIGHAPALMSKEQIDIVEAFLDR